MPPTLPFKPRSSVAGAFAAVRYPAGMPTALRPDPGAISYAASALAALAGEDLDAISVERFDEFRRLAIFAAALAHREGQMLAGYYLQHMAGEHAPGLQLTELEPDHRLNLVARQVCGLQRALLAFAGLSSPRRHAEIVDALRRDVTSGLADGD